MRTCIDCQTEHQTNRIRCEKCHKIKRKALMDDWKARNPSYQKSYRKQNIEKRHKYNMDWIKNNHDKYLVQRKNYKKRMRETSPKYRIVNSLRCRLYDAVINGYKSASTLELLGCETDFLLEHLEKQFQPGMTWDNYGLKGWHIDHIVPCDSFDLLKPEEQRKCFHYSNLQPLWAVDNIRKHAKVL